MTTTIAEGCASILIESDYFNTDNQSQAINQEQEANIIALAQEVGADIPKFCQFLRVNHISELPLAQYERAIQALEAKRKAA